MSCCENGEISTNNNMVNCENAINTNGSVLSMDVGNQTSQLETETKLDRTVMVCDKQTNVGVISARKNLLESSLVSEEFTVDSKEIVKDANAHTDGCNGYADVLLNSELVNESKPSCNATFVSTNCNGIAVAKTEAADDFLCTSTKSVSDIDSLNGPSTSSTDESVASLKRPLENDNFLLEPMFEKRCRRSDSSVTNCQKSDKQLITKKLDALIKNKIQELINSKNSSIITELQKQVEELQMANSSLLTKYKELQRQIVEASIVKQRMKRNAANNKVPTKNVCLQVDELKLQTTQRQQTALAVTSSQMQRVTPQFGQQPVVHSQQPISSVSPQKSVLLSQAQVRLNQPPTVRQLISTQKAAGMHSSAVSLPNILRHATSSPQVVDLTDDDDVTTKSNRPTIATRILANGQTVASTSYVPISRIERSVSQSVISTRPVQTVVAFQVATPGGLTANALAGHVNGQQQSAYVVTSNCSTATANASVPTGLARFNGSPTLLQALSPLTLLQPSAGIRLPGQPAVVTPQSSRTVPALPVASATVASHPAPLPVEPTEPVNPLFKPKPPRPALKIQRVEQGIVLSWNIVPFNKDEWAEIASYQLYAYQEGTAQPSSNLWKKVGDVKALALPMACTLTQFQEGNTYHFAVRAIDVHNRRGQFSEATSIFLSPNC